jgi:hypothetical protein
VTAEMATNTSTSIGVPQVISYNGVNTSVGSVPSSASLDGEQPPASSLVSGLGPFNSNWLALVIIIVGGAFLLLSFFLARLLRWVSFRRQITFKPDNKGQLNPYHSTSGKLLQWSGTVLQKLSLYSFVTPGIPSVGVILLITSWIGFCLLITLVNVERDLNGLAFRLP